MTTRERIAYLFLIIAVIVFLIVEYAEADNWEYYDRPETYYVQPTLPGFNIPDSSQPGYRVEVDRYGNERGYPTVPGFNIRDYSQPGYRLDRR